METPENRTRATFRWDTARGAGQGALDALRNTFLLLVAIRVFHAPDLIKAFLPASVFMGMLLTPLTLALTAGRRVRMGLLGAVYAAVTGCALIASAFASNLFIYLGLAAGAQIVSAQWIPLMTHIYASNYNERHRGALFSATFLLVSLVGAAVSYAGGWLLDLDLSYWKIVFVLTGTAVLMSAVAMLRMPTSPMTRIAARNPWESISLAWKDKTFGAVLASWFIMGLGNLLTMPLRVEYLANPAFGINASNERGSDYRRRPHGHAAPVHPFLGDLLRPLEFPHYPHPDQQPLFSLARPFLFHNKSLADGAGQRHPGPGLRGRQHHVDFMGDESRSAGENLRLHERAQRPDRRARRPRAFYRLFSAS